MKNLSRSLTRSRSCQALVALSAAHGRNWAMYPLMGWGLGLLIHGAVVWFVAGGGFYDRLVERERRALGAGDRG